MSQAEPVPERPVLGVGQIMADVLVLFFRRLPKIMLLALPGGLGIAGVLYGTFAMEDYWSGLFATSDFRPGFIAGIAAVAIALGTGLGLAAGPLTTAFHSYQLRRQVPLGSCARTLTRRPIAAVMCGVMVTLATLAPLALSVYASTAWVGFFLAMVLISAGMYAMGRWGLSLPAISMDRMGLSALGRASRLGEGYRWSIAGTCFLLWFTSFLLGGMLSAGLALLVGATLELVIDVNLDPDVEGALVFIDAVLGLTAATALLALGFAAIRARMVEIKEPPDIAEMVEVFD